MAKQKGSSYDDGPKRQIQRAWDAIPQNRERILQFGGTIRAAITPTLDPMVFKKPGQAYYDGPTTAAALIEVIEFQAVLTGARVDVVGSWIGVEHLVDRWMRKPSREEA